jgi:hypothetical protein
MTVASPVNLESSPCQESPELQLWRQVLYLRDNGFHNRPTIDDLALTLTKPFTNFTPS